MRCDGPDGAWTAEIDGLLALGDIDSAEALVRLGDDDESGAVAPRLRYRSRLLLKRFHWDAALRVLHHAAELADRGCDWIESIRCLGELATIASTYGRHDEGRDAITRCEQTAARHPNLDHSVLVQCFLARHALARQQGGHAREAVTRALRSMSDGNSSDVAVECVNVAVLVEAHVPTLTTSRSTVMQVLSLVRHGLISRSAVVVARLFRLLMFRGEHHTAHQLIDIVRAETDRSLPEARRARFLGALGSRLAVARWNGSAIPLLRDAVALCEALDMRTAEAIARCHLGDALLWIGDREGVGQLVRARILSHEGRLRHRTALVLLAIADDDTRVGAFDDAADALNGVIEIAKERDDQGLHFLLCLHAARLEIARGRLPQAGRHSEDALSLAVRHGRESDVCHAALVRGLALQECDADAARSHFQDADATAARLLQLHERLTATQQRVISAVDAEDYVAARELCRDRRDLLEAVQADYMRVDQRQRILEAWRPLLLLDVHVCLVLGHTSSATYFEEAFDVAQLFRNRTFTDISCSEDTEARVLEPTAFVEDERVVTRERRWHAHALAEIKTGQC